MVQRAINVEVKTGLRSIIEVWDLDIYCPRGHPLFNSITFKVQTQETYVKNFSRLEEPKTKDLKSILLCTNMAKLSK